MPSDDPGPDIGPLNRLVIQSLSELPIHVQLMLLDRAAPKRAVLWFGADGPVTPPNSPISYTWIFDHRHELAAGLLRHHGLDRDRIAILQTLGALGPPPPIADAAVRFSFAAPTSPAAGLSLEAAAFATAFLLRCDAAFRTAFAALDPSDTLDDVEPRVRLAGGSVRALLSGSAAGIGLLIVLDAVSGGAMLPITWPLYAKAVAGGALIMLQGVDYLNDQRNKFLTGTKTKAETEKALADALKARTEAAALQERAASDSIKARAEAEKALLDVRKLAAELADRPTDPGAVRAAPAAAAVPMRAIAQAASANKVGMPVAVLALNVGLPLLIEAYSAGVSISRLGPTETI